MVSDGSLDFAWMRRALYTAVIADVLDALGLREQVIDFELRRVSGGGVLVGRAKTTLWEEIDQIDPRPYELELKAVDEGRADEVLIVAAGGSTRSGVWGELLSAAARNRRCAGVIVDGAVRDVVRMNELGFTVFARSTCPRDSLHRQRVVAVDVGLELGGVRIEPGDLVFADADGAVVVPQAVEREALAKAMEKATAENRVRDEIRAGMKATEAFRKYGVL
jgi:regulator of RNase E activity RraA